MSANPHRRGILGLLGTAPIAIAGSGSPTAILGRGRALALPIPGLDNASGTLGQAADQVRGLGIPGIGAAIERANPLEAEIPVAHVEFITRFGSDPAVVARQIATEARAIAALAPAFPPEIAAYRSFARHLRRRLYAELLVRESQRVSSGEPPPDPPATSDPGA